MGSSKEHTVSHSSSMGDHQAPTEPMRRLEGREEDTERAGRMAGRQPSCSDLSADQTD